MARSRKTYLMWEDDDFQSHQSHFYDNNSSPPTHNASSNTLSKSNSKKTSALNALFFQFIKNTFNFKERFKRYYPTSIEGYYDDASENHANIYAGQTWKGRFTATYHWSKQWLNYIGSHLVEVLIGGFKDATPKEEAEDDIVGGLTTIILGSMTWCSSHMA